MSAVLAIYDALIQAGIAEQPARRIVEAFERDMTTVLATKVDLFAVKEDVASVRQEVGILRQDVGTLRQEVSALRQDVGTLRQEGGTLRQEVAGVRQEVVELRGNIALLDSKIDSVEGRMTIRMENFADRTVVRLGGLMVGLFTVTGVISGVLFALYR